MVAREHAVAETHPVDELAAAFLQRLSPEVRDRFADVEHAALDEQLRQTLELATATHPGLRVPPLRFLQHIASNLEEPAQLSRLLTGDLYWAVACLDGDAEALALFEARLVPELKRGLGDAEALQDARVRLLVGTEDRPPKLSSYAGRGPLLHWIRVTAVRMRADGQRKEARRRELPDLEHLQRMPGGEPAVDTAYLRSRYGPVIKDAFNQAMARIEPRQRTWLRQHLVDGLSMREMAGIYGTDHKKVGRWLEQARTAVWEHAGAVLASEHAIEPDELESLIRLVRSQLDLSMSRVLR